MPSSVPSVVPEPYKKKLDPSRGHSSHRLSSLAIALVFVGWTLFILPLALICALATIFLRKDERRRAFIATLTRKSVTAYGRVTLFLLRPWISVHIENAHAAARCSPCIIIANHQSFLDLYLLAAQAEANLCLVSKAWPFRLLFFFAPIMKLAGYIDAQSLSLEETEHRCLHRLAEGASLVFFPEGRRTRDGQLGRFHAGAFMLAEKAQVPIVPLVIHNSYSIFPPNAQKFMPGSIRMCMLSPLFPIEFVNANLPHRAMLRKAKERILHQLQTSLRENL